MSDEKITAAGEEAARSHILGLVADYCDKYHNKKGPFEEGQRIPYASRVYDSSEMVNLVDSALEFWLTSGRYTDRFEKGLAGLRQGAELVQRELSLTRPLVTQGAASKVEVLRLERQKNELENKITEMKNQYYVRAREELAKANAEMEAQRSVMKGREDSLTRLTFNAPVRGIVKDIDVTTVGGVIPPNGKLMSLVPLDDQMLIEAKISPRDVAFIHPGQKALVKITAYDYSIYGGLEGEVTMISPDTLQDEVKRDVYYYRVYIRTDSNHLTNKQGKTFPVFPGMISTVDIKTGSKTIIDYLLKPLNKAKEAMRER